MKNQLGTMENHENRPGTMQVQPGRNKQKRYKQNLPIILFSILPPVVAIGTDMSYVEEMQLFPSGISNERKVKGTWVQYAATRKQKVGMLQILLDAG